MRELATERLALRALSVADQEPMARLHGDAAVMAYLGGTMDRAASAAFVARSSRHWDEHGFGFWAVEVPGAGLIGAVGLLVPRFEAHFTPCVELAWRFGRDAWGQGYATEAARALVRIGFETLRRDELVALTVPCNTRSRAVMARLNMTHDASDDFDHPLVAASSPLRRHVLYRLQRAQGH